MFLSKAERDYLIANDNNKFNPGYDRVIRSRLNKKIQRFVSQELPLLVEKGLVTEFRNVTEKSNNVNIEPTCPFGHGISKRTERYYYLND